MNAAIERCRRRRPHIGYDAELAGNETFVSAMRAAQWCATFRVCTLENTIDLFGVTLSCVVEQSKPAISVSEESNDRGDSIDCRRERDRNIRVQVLEDAAKRGQIPQNLKLDTWRPRRVTAVWQN